MSWMETKECPVCRATEIAPYSAAIGKPYMEAELPFTSAKMAIVVEYAQCLRCGIVFQNPRMDNDTINKFYAEGHYRKLTGSSESVDADEKIRADRVSELLFGGYGLAPRSHLDVGCSRGYLLQNTKKYVDRVVGLDWNENYCLDEAIPVAGSVEALGYETFDLITMVHVLEHSTDPLLYLETLAQLLNHNGKMYIEVPSKNSKGGPLRLAHTFYFEPWVLVGLAERARLRVEYITVREHTQMLVKAV